MMILLLSLGSAFFIGLSNVLIRKGLDSTTRTQSILISLLTSTFVFWVISAALVDLRLFFVPAALFFVLAGLFGPGIGRMLNITSLKRIGVSRTISITGIAPFFATVAAILFLGESYSFSIFAGTVFVIVGIYMLSNGRKNGKSVFEKKDLLFSFGAACFGGLSIAVTKKGLLELPEPIVGMTLALTTALVLALTYILASQKIPQLRFSLQANKFPLFAGLATSGAFLLNFSVLKVGDVSIVAPLLSTFPLFGVFLSHFFLNEEITGRVWLGAVIIITGVAVINVF